MIPGQGAAGPFELLYADVAPAAFNNFFPVSRGRMKCGGMRIKNDSTQTVETVGVGGRGIRGGEEGRIEGRTSNFPIAIARQASRSRARLVEIFVVGPSSGRDRRWWGVNGPIVMRGEKEFGWRGGWGRGLREECRLVGRYSRSGFNEIYFHWMWMCFRRYFMAIELIILSSLFCGGKYKFTFF